MTLLRLASAGKELALLWGSAKFEMSRTGSAESPRTLTAQEYIVKTLSHSAELVTIENTPFLAIVRSLTDDAGNITRAKGGLWVNLSGDPKSVALAIADAAKSAYAFISLAEEAMALLAKQAAAEKAKPVAVKAPTPPTEREKLLAQLAALDAPVSAPVPAPAPAKNPPTAQAKRDAIVAKAAEERKALSVAAPAKIAPAKVAEFDWAALIGQSA